MAFNSVQFLIFFPIVFLTYILCSHVIKRNSITQLVLLAFSLFFYACWKPEYLVLILISVVITYSSGILMEKYAGWKKLILTVSLVSNLSILFFFKYFNFFADSINWCLAKSSAGVSIGTLNVLLPVGISFYTFQALGYSIDVYRGTVKAERNFITYALFVTFFPQLVAGPIERTNNLLPQFKVDYTFDYDRITSGLKLAAWGFFEKVVVADRLAVYVNGIFNNLSIATGSSVILAAFFFSFQVLCDFSGYSDIAIGVARILGFNLMRNFRRPFFSKSIGEIWTRWHISLSTWFKDYLYFPLGGSRVSKFRHCLNLLIVMTVSGVWHGAAWHYVLWGVMHGFYQIVGILTAPVRTKVLVACHLGRYDSSVKGGLRIKRGWQFVKIIITFALFVFAAIMFRVNSMADYGHIFGMLLQIPAEISGALHSVPTDGIVTAVRNLFVLDESLSGFGIKHCAAAFGLVMILLLIDYVTRFERGFYIIKRQHFIIRWICYYAIVFAILFLSVTGKTEFVYFQF